MPMSPEEILKDLHGGEYINLDSIKLETVVRFRFDGHHIILRSTDGETFSVSAVNDLAVFEVGYNAKTGMPQIGWETHPETDMLRAAVDIIVAFFVKSAQEAGFDVTKLPKLFHPAEA